MRALEIGHDRFVDNFFRHRVGKAYKMGMSRYKLKIIIADQCAADRDRAASAQAHDTDSATASRGYERDDRVHKSISPPRRQRAQSHASHSVPPSLRSPYLRFLFQS